MVKLEIIDNRIKNYYEYTVFQFKKKYWWSFNKTWIFKESHVLGKKYMCPEIHKGLKTIEELFHIEVEMVKKRYNFIEIHNIVITK
jgi:hypothetical protein